ncbi:efflux RND transporter permease subunit [Marinicella gelatinilytica]|uniref:efflux RND transporter permease subunit n=1 Tax=Marinicella gelatinilytica TaxID=2996017 RepID=UPI0022608184|nr:efflux RND transporter permease subunit [Marinicella gelatinilytica]MCX7546117.1 efflux RND transporter permease subunit [Marinicella gelatinilytica]
MSKQWDRGIIYWFASNPVAANLMMVCILVVGFAIAFNLKKEMFPTTTINQVSINMVYPGAAPDEVEKGLCIKLEDAISGLEGIDKITCVANEGMARTYVEVDSAYDVKQVMAEIKNRVDGVNSFPEQAEKPIISEVLAQQPVMFVSLHGLVPESELLEISQHIRNELVDLPDVSLAELIGYRPYEIGIEVTEMTLREYQLTFDEIAGALQRASLDLPGGAIKTERGDVLLRTVGQSYTGKQYADTVIRTNPDGSRLRLGDIAIIKDAFVEDRVLGTFDGQPAISIQVNSVETESVLDISDQVHQFVDNIRPQLPANIDIDAWLDTSFYVRGRLDMMQRNMVQGAILVIIILTLFMRLRVAFWVMLGLPVAFLGAFLLMPYLGVTMNMLSMFGLILVLGIVVDDAIVIGESAYAEIQDHGHSLKNVVIGAQRVAVPATFGVLTTVAAFAPMLFVGTLFGSFFEAVGWVVILCLLFSLVESKLILPAHLAHMNAQQNNPNPGPLLRLQRKIDRGLQSFISKRYQPTIEKAVNRPGLTLTIFAAIFILSISLINNGLVRFVMLPDFASDIVQAEFAMAQGTPQSRSIEVLTEVQDALIKLDREISEEYGLESGAVFKHRLAFLNSQTSGRVIVELLKDEEAYIDSKTVMRRWQENIGEIVGATYVGTVALAGPGQGPDISLKLVGPDVDNLQKAADMVADKLKSFEGVYDVRNSLEAGKDEVQLKIKPLGRNLGLTQYDIGHQVRQAFYGDEVQRIQRGNDEIRVMLRYDRAARESMQSLQELRIRTPQGDQVPLNTVADIQIGKAPNSIERVNRKRAARITAQVDKAVANPQAIAAKIQPANPGDPIVAEFPAIKSDLDGISKEMAELAVNFVWGIAMALLLIYVLMAVPLKSYGQPLIIMSAIPFGVTGAIIGHWMLGLTFSMMSLFGIIALFGVVVNDSLVMVDYINNRRSEGQTLVEAVRYSGSRRFRAIMLTSLTTFFGLMPIMFEQSLQAKVIVPMAVSLAFGIMFATVITLILIPSLYVLLERIKLRFSTQKPQPIEQD